MKLRDVIEAVGNRKHLIQFYCDWAVTLDNHIIPKFEAEITMDSDVEIYYQWYTHLNPNVNTKAIEDAIENHDYKTFTKWLNKLSQEPWEYLPSRANLWSGDAYIGTVCVAYDEELFSLITDNGYECG